MNNVKSIEKITMLFLFLFSLAFASCSEKAPMSKDVVSGSVTGKTSIEILYLNHGPVLRVLDKLDPVFKKYGARLSVTKLDFDTQEAGAYARNKNLTGHIPLAIFINGSLTATIGGRSVSFISFPKGLGTGMIADGDWSASDLDQAISKAVGE